MFGLQGGAGVYPRGVVKTRCTQHRVGLAPKGRIASPTCTLERLAESVCGGQYRPDTRLAGSEWVNICRLQLTCAARLVRQTALLKSHWVRGGLRGVGKIFPFQGIPRDGEQRVSPEHVRVLTRWSAFVSVMTRVSHPICAANPV